MKEIVSNLSIQKNLNLKIKDSKYYHNEVSKILQSLSYKEKFNIVKNVDRNLLKKVNTFTGTKAVHTLDYISSIPYKKKELSLKEEVLLKLRTMFMLWAVKDYFVEKRRNTLKVVK